MKKQVYWIIENITKEESYTELYKACLDNGYECKLISGDFNYNDLDYLTHDKDPKCVIFNGSIEMTKIINSRLKGLAYPISFCNFNNFLCSKYYSYFGDYLFNDKYIILTLSEFYRNKWFIYGSIGKDSKVFIRPDSGEKLFQAQVLDIIDLERFMEVNDCFKHELVLISSPKDIKWEGRFIVDFNGRIISHSSYRFQGNVTKIYSVPKEAKDKCQEILNKTQYFPDSVFCIDICQGYDDKFYLLELTSFSSAGLYKSNKNDIVKGVSEIALKAFDYWNLPF